MITKDRESQIIGLIKREVKPALGCTEPIAVSLAVAKASEVLKNSGKEISKIEVLVSANILKNGMGVGIPGTGMVGLHIAAALGATCGKSEYKLEVLKDLNQETIKLAKEMVNQGVITISLAKTEKKLYIEAICYSQEESSSATIEDSHDSITKVTHNESIIFSQKEENNQATGSHPKEMTTPEYKLTVKEILDFARNTPYEEIEFLLESARLNTALANEGLDKDYGLMVGKTIMDTNQSDIFGNGIIKYAMALTAAASDARMAGCTLPAMSNSGSGNQGITVTMPVIAVADKIGSSKEELARALALSHLIAIHIKGYLGKLSALCGCVIASTGSSCGIILLSGGGYDQICSAIKNMVGNITGMVCDGAKVGCALKVASGVSSSMQAAVLAMKNICISSNDGIIEDDIEKTIQNLGKIGAVGMQDTDKMILDIMVNKG